MTYSTLIEVDQLSANLHNPDWIIVDCRFNLADTAAGREAYTNAHIPGAVYAHLDDDLSSEPVTDQGRHPLPSPATMTTTFGRLGIGGDKQVVAYDNAGGMIAGRLWWMLHYMGHRAAAVLNGGWQAWQAADLPTESGVQQNPPALFTGEPQPDWLILLEEVQSADLLIDSRDPARYRGDVEPLDARAGHIPGAVNFPFRQNLGADGRFRSPPELRAQFKALLGEIPSSQATFYCGSGVSACVNLLALAHAGLGHGRLYAGSWSEWSRNPDRPIAIGDSS